MRTALGLALALPLVGALAVVVLEPTPLAAAAITGMALVVASHLPRSLIGASSWLCAIAVFAVASTPDAGSGTDGAFAVGVVVVAALVVAGARAGGAERGGTVPVLAGAALTTVGLLLGDALIGIMAVVAGAGLIAASGAWVGSALVLVPAALLATARSVGETQSSRGADDVAIVGLVAALVALLAAVGVWFLLGRVGPGSAHGHGHADGRGHGHGGPRPERLYAVAGVLGGIALVGQDLADLRAAGLLIVAGAVLAGVARHPLGVVAFLPGLAAAVEAFGEATDLVHAVGGASAAVILFGAALAVPGLARPDQARPDQRLIIDDWPVIGAVGFAAVPLWGWTGAAIPGYAEAVATAGAGAAVAAAALVLAGMVPPGLGSSLGRLRGRQLAVTHGSTNPQAQAAGPVEDHHRLQEEDPVEGLVAPEERSVRARIRPVVDPAADPAQRPLAGPPGPVHGGAVPGRLRGRGRLRRRPGRAAR